MEEATELFGLMQERIRLAEAARMRPVPAPEAKPARRAPAAPGTGAVPLSDEMLLAGVLAMGAGTGLLAAIAKRMGEGAPAARSTEGRSGSRTASR